MSRSQNLKRIVDLCTELKVDFGSVDFYGGYKQVMFTLPEHIIDALRDENGDYATQAYDEFCDKYCIWYDSEWECWG